MNSSLNPIAFAMRHPVSVMAGVAALAVASLLAVERMAVDVFPASVFAAVQARSRTESPSIDPRDPESVYFHPDAGEPLDRQDSDSADGGHHLSGEFIP